MRKLLVAIIAVSLCIGTYGCGRTSLYRGWGAQLRDMPLRNGRVEDVSMLLGSSPSRCEPIENPRPVIGINLDPSQKQPFIINVQLNGPAYQAGIRSGDIIRRIGEQSVATPEQALSTLSNSLRAGQAINIETSRGVVSVVPSIPNKAEQCYWDVQGGRVAKRGSYAAVNSYGGSSASRGSAYERFFRTSCRIYDGFVNMCNSNWQE
jgi:membrane-associated protease RseP (regulator of RpoE activity)